MPVTRNAASTTQGRKGVQVFLDGDCTRITVERSATGQGTHTRWIHTTSSQTARAFPDIVDSTLPSPQSTVSELTPPSSLSSSPSADTRPQTPEPDPAFRPRASAMKLQARTFSRIEFWKNNVSAEEDVAVASACRTSTVEKRRQLERIAAEEKQRQQTLEVFEKQLGILKQGKSPESGRQSEIGDVEFMGEDLQQFWQGGDDDLDLEEGHESGSDFMDEDEDECVYASWPECLDSDGHTDIMIDDDVPTPRKAFLSNVAPVRRGAPLGPHGTELLDHSYVPPVRDYATRTSGPMGRGKGLIRQSTEPVL